MTAEDLFNVMWATQPHPMQVECEFKQALLLARQRKVKTVLEIGSTGRQAPYWLAVAGAEQVIAIDPRNAGKGRPPKWVAIQGDSHDPAVQECVDVLLRDRLVDLLFIDGDHTMEGVTCDTKDYARFTGPTTVLMYHDILPNREPGVAQFWAHAMAGVEAGCIKQTPLEFLHPTPAKAYGIGVLLPE